MENTEIMTTNEVIDTAEEVVKTIPMGVKVACGMGLIGIGAYLGYRLYTKIKEKKNSSRNVIAVVEDDQTDLEEVDD